MCTVAPDDVTFLLDFSKFLSCANLFQHTLSSVLINLFIFSWPCSPYVTVIIRLSLFLFKLLTNFTWLPHMAISFGPGYLGHAEVV